MLDIVLGTKDMVLNKTHKICCQKEFICFEGDKISKLSTSHKMVTIWRKGEALGCSSQQRTHREGNISASLEGAKATSHE